MAQHYRKAKQNHALKLSYVWPLVRQFLFMAWIREHSYKGNTESKGALQLLSNSTSVKSTSCDVVHAQCLEDNTGNLKLVSGEPLLQQQEGSSDKVNSETVLTAVRKNCTGKGMSKAICLVKVYNFVSITIIVVDSCVCVPPSHPWPQPINLIPLIYYHSGLFCSPEHSWLMGLKKVHLLLLLEVWIPILHSWVVLSLMLKGKLTESFKPIHTTFLSPCP